MADLLTHVLLAYAGCTIAGWYRPIPDHWVAVVMIGSILPDLNRVSLIVTSGTLDTVLGVPFDFDALSTLGGAIVLAGIGSMVVDNQHQRTFAALLAGAGSHFIVDGIKAYADGSAGMWLYPLTWARHPTPNLYVSSDPGVVVLAGAVTAVIMLVNQRIERAKETEAESHRREY